VKGEASNALFISYRREVGGILAMALYQHLTERGLDAFYDIESIRAGQFDTIILNQIAARPYFLLVLTPGTLEGASDPSDWLRRETEQALATRRVIVPAHTPNFDFGDFERFLPGDLGREVRRFNGQELPQRWFKFAVQQLVEEFLLPIQIENVAPPAAEQAVVDRLLREAQAAPVVTERHLSAQEYLERAVARPNDDLEGMLADYSEALRLNPQYTEAFSNRGVVRAAMGDLEGAIADYDVALRLDPHYAYAFNNRGIARRAMGDLEGAIADYDEAIRLNHLYAYAFSNRGNARRAMGDLEGAIADHDEALRLNSRFARGFYSRGNARRDMGDLEGAIADYTEALALNPRNTEASYNRGITRADKGDLDGAIVDFTEALRLKPQHAGAFYNRALAHRNKGDLDGAIADVEQGARIAPEDEDFPRLLDELRAAALRTK
jgi:tetratricopeptide (TPR) repeat protein